MSELSATSMWIRRGAGVVFVVAGIGKLLSEAAYLTPVLFDGIIGPIPKTSWAIERALPWIEIVVGMALVLSFGLSVARRMAIGMCVLFLGVVWLLPDSVSCNCFGLFGAIDDRLVHTAFLAVLLGCCAWGGGGKSICA